jgi:HTH-type transcriptional regulator/antitoxin HigA
MSRTSIASRRHSAASDDYLDLIKELPIRPITSAREHRAAQAILDRLIGREDLSKGQLDYLAALVRFVEDYERERFTLGTKRLTPIELLRHLMEENDMNTSDLGYVLGSRGLASEVLNGKRGLSKTLIRRLSERFHLDPSLFLDTKAGSAVRSARA